MTAPGEPPQRPWARVAGLVIVVAFVGLAVVLVLSQLVPTSARPPLDDVATSSGAPTADARYDPDGVPKAIDGEPVLRGAAIVTRAARNDPAPFLVAGWQTQEPRSSCMPTPVHCDATSLVDAPESDAWRIVTLETPDGFEYAYDWRSIWAGGFHVLRVRAACAWYESTCLVVDEPVGPTAALPDAGDGFDADGLPRTVDGQPVVRGGAIPGRLDGNPDILPVWIAGRVEAIASPGPSDPRRATCQDLATWEPHQCPLIRFGDPDQGLSLDANARVLTAWRWGLQAGWTPGSTWPDGSVVLLASGDFVIDTALPPSVDVAAQPAPMPSIGFSQSSYRKRTILSIDERPVRSGDEIARDLEPGSTETSLVTGVVRQRPCDTCDAGFVTELLEPTVRDPATATGAGYPLVRRDGTPFEPGAPMIWRHPQGIVVLEVRVHDAPCPDAASCPVTIEVLRVVSPPDP